jgi:hypothetical protein
VSELASSLHQHGRLLVMATGGDATAAACDGAGGTDRNQLSCENKS